MASPFQQPIQIDMAGYNRVMNQLRAMASAHPRKTNPIIGAHARQQRAKLKGRPYPHKLPNQKYIRTGELANRWEAIQVKPGVWRISNRRRGVVAVVKKGFQNRKYHLGRWWTVEDVLAEDMPQLTRNLTAMLDGLLKK